ncbi:uncharacterized protein METZ01_LOCUS167507 [marine metagenome]|uniref:Uncharacterized protein n=1 Tax=marine metagenome TaxID=408172 RepID=A0A382BNG4_9ZZZZ
MDENRLAMDLNRQVVLQSVLALIIPADEGLPSAADLDSQLFMETEMESNPEIKTAVTIVIELVQSRCKEEFEKEFIDCNVEQQIESLSLIETAHRDLFRILLTLVYSFYYTHPKVLKMLKPGTGPPQPKGYSMEMGLIELRKNVEARGRLYRDS